MKRLDDLKLEAWDDLVAERDAAVASAESFRNKPDYWRRWRDAEDALERIRALQAEMASWIQPVVSGHEHVYNRAVARAANALGAALKGPDTPSS